MLHRLDASNHWDYFPNQVLCEHLVRAQQTLSDDGQNHDTDVKKGLLNAYRRFMAPLVRILIRNGISFNEFADELRGVYVDVAATDFPIEGRSPSGTRVAILTGLTRKEVKRQFDRTTTGGVIPNDKVWIGMWGNKGVRMHFYEFGILDNDTNVLSTEDETSMITYFEENYGF